MKLRLNYLTMIMAALLLSGCGGDSLLGDSSADVDPLVPEIEVDDGGDQVRPPENAAVITTDGKQIFDISGKPILMRGVNLQFGDSPTVRIAGIEPIADIGSNVVRLQLRENTTADALEAALNAIVENNMIAMVMLWEEEGKITCTEDESFLFEAVETLWLDRWLPVLAQERFQSHLMINVANEWGPLNIWNANSVGYADYIDTYKIIIRDFRDAGFKVPLVIDAPHCGQDYNAFLGGRGRELLAADVASNVVLSAHAYGSHWNSSDKIVTATDLLSGENVPFIVGEFGGSQVNGDVSIDHLDLMAKGQGDMSLVFRFPWQSVNDKAAYAYTLDGENNFNGAIISFDVYVDNAYKVDGNLGFQVFIKDADYRYASLGFQSMSELRSNAWNRVNLTVANMDDLDYVSDGFELNRVTQLGFEVAANGKGADISADILFDNVDVKVGAPPEPIYAASFDDDLEDWAYAWGTGDSTALSQANGALNLLAPWGGSDTATSIGYGSAAWLAQTIDLQKPLSVSVDIFIPEEYASETGLSVQLFMNDNSWNYFARLVEVGADGLTAGQWNTVSVSLSDFMADVSYADPDFDVTLPPQRFGLEIGGVSTAKTEAVLVDNFEIFSEQVSGSGISTLYEATFENEEYWSFGWGAGDETSMSQANGELLLLAPWGATAQDSAFGYGSAASLSPSIDLAQPFSVSMDVFVPMEYADEADFAIQVYINDNTWNGFASLNYATLSTLVAGEWNNVSVDIENLVTDANSITDGYVLDLPPQRFGFEIKGVSSAKTEAIRVDNFRITAASVSDAPLETVLELDFTDSAEIDAFELSFFEGDSWVESSLENAKVQDFGVDPFGWIAWSWKGNGPGYEGLDMSLSEGMVDLSQRGEEIANGDNGIAATAEDVIFE